MNNRSEQSLHSILALEQAWQEFQTTGQHVTAQEVEAWLSRWGTENEQSAPSATSAKPATDPAPSSDPA